MPETDAAPASVTADARSSLRRPVERPVPLRRLVFDAIIEMIINRDLQPGQHLSEADLAQTLGVSRQPIREALQQLQTEGWVNLRQGQGAFVHAPTRKETDDLLAVRIILEAESAREAALGRSDADIAKLWALWHHGTEVAAKGDREAMVAANAELHAYIMSIGGNSVLAELGRVVDRRVRWHYTPIAVVRGSDSWDEHAELIHAIAEGDADKAAAIMREHAGRTRTIASDESQH
ncbi:MAG TPA: GntR family transcriptional regulator [Micromonosporaceae bacterium]|jgi:DNA-binding GntR family transcriptional regulator